MQRNKAGVSVAVTEWSIRDGRVNLGLKECMHTFCMFITIIASFSPPMPTKGRGDLPRRPRLVASHLQEPFSDKGRASTINLLLLLLQLSLRMR